MKQSGFTSMASAMPGFGQESGINVQTRHDSGFEPKPENHQPAPKPTLKHQTPGTRTPNAPYGTWLTDQIVKHIQEYAQGDKTKAKQIARKMLSQQQDIYTKLGKQIPVAKYHLQNLDMVGQNVQRYIDANL